ncbi:Stage II sporulation protein E (SpoIIE) [compost metagenome]
MFCTDGIFEAGNAVGDEFGAGRLCDVVRQNAEGSAREIVDAIFEPATSFRGGEPQNDDMTAVAVRITA